jgi:fibronectin type 3 domain-containing protein
MIVIKSISLLLLFILTSCQVKVIPDADIDSANKFTVTTPLNISYVPGSTIPFTLTFPKVVIVTGTPQLNLTIGATARTANYVSGSGTAILIFNYVVQTGEDDTNGIALTSPISLNGGALMYDVTKNCILTFTLPNFATVLVDSTDPTVTPVNPPSGIALAASPGQMLLNWNSALGANSYKIFRGTTSGSLTEIANGIVANTYTDTTTTDGTTYFYAIKAFKSHDSVLSSEVSARSISAFNITSVTVGPAAAQLTVNWPGTTGASAYDIKYGTNPASLNLIGSNVTSPHVLSGLIGGTTYYVRVIAQNTVGVGTILNSTNQLSGTPIASIAAPTGLVASANPGQAGLNWNAVSGASSYKVYRGTASGVLSLLASGVASNAYLDTTVANGTTYFYTVRAFNGSDSAESAEVSVRPISTFSLTAATSTSATIVDLTWGAAAGADTYDVRYGTASGVYLTSVLGVTSPYTLAGLTANTQYFISIRASNAVGTGTNSDSNERSTTTATAAPTALVATATTGQIDLAWTAASGATSYRILRGTVSGSYTQIATGVTGISFTDTTNANGTQYYYVIRSFNGIESGNSNEATAESIASFSIASISAPTTSTIQVTWSGPAGASAYDVRYGTSSGSYTTLSSVTSPYTITGLASGTNYYIAVRARNLIGTGSSFQTSEVTQVTPLAAPTGLVANAISSQVNLSWTAVTGATSYKVYRGTTTGSHVEIANGVGTNSYSDGSIVNGTSYFYVVTAYNGADSAISSEVSIRPVANFASVIATTLDATTIQVSWPSVSGAASYDMKYGTSSGTYTTTLTNQTSPKTISGLSAASIYYIIIEAKNAVGNGTTTTSTEVSVTTSFGAPTSLLASATTGSVSLTWAAIAGASSYKVFRGTVSGTYAEIANGVPTNSYVDTTVSDGTTYFYVVKAYNGTDSAYSNEVTIRSISTFTFASATPASATSATLTWGAATGAATYDVRYGTSSGIYTQTAAGVTSPYSITGLSAGSTYYVSIRAKNAIGSGTNSDSNQLSVLTSPAAPQGLAAQASTNQIVLTWSAAATATTYNIYRGTSSGSYSSLASGVAGLTYTDSTVTNGTTYFYVVRASNGSESVNTSEVSGRSITAFSISSTTAPTTSTIQVTWPATAGAATYDVRYGTSTGSYSTTVTGQTSPYTITGLTGGTNYYIVVRAVNAIGSGSTATSAEVSQVTPLSAPTGLSAASTPGSVALTWSAVAGATNYKIYRGTVSGTYTSLATGNVPTSYTDATAANGTTYFYIVKAFNGANSADSNEISTRPIANFSITSTSSPTSTTALVTWTGPAGGATYDVRYGTATGSYSTTVTGQTSPYTITGLTAGTTYYIVVKAINAIGAGTNVTSSESTQLTALGAPTGLAAAATPGSVALTWGAVAGATNYKIYRGTTTGVLSLFASGNVPASYTDVTAANGTTYYYAVRAFNGSDSADSAEVAVQSISSFSLTAATTASSSSINLTWGTATGAATYDVRYGTSTGVYLTTVSSVTSPFTLTGLTSGTTYFVSIRAKNAVGAGTNFDSNEMNAKTSPSVASSLVATATTGQISLSWAAASGATNYNIYRGTATGVYSQIASANVTTTYVDSAVTNGTQYFYVVRAFNGTESANSSEVTARSIAAFTISSTTAPTTSTIQVTWPATAGAATYDVRYGTSTGSYTTTVAEVTSPYTITALTGGTNYFIVVRAVNAIGSGSTATTPEVTQITPLTAPTGLAATSTPASVALTWNTVVGATNYKIYRGTSTGSYSSLATGNVSTSYTDATAVNGTQYFYVVKAFNGADSADSNEVTARSIASFSIASTTSPTSTTVQVTWPSPAGGATYDVRYGTATGSYTTTVTGQTSPYTITGLIAGTNYFIVVRANNAIGAGTSVTSSESSQLTALGAPTGLAAAATPGSVALTWGAVAGATNYKIYRGTTTGVLSLFASGNVPASYTDATVANGTTYYYAVRAFNGSDSADSAEVAVRSISTFTFTSAITASASTIDLIWTAAAGAATYDVRYGTANGTYGSTAASVTSPYTLTGLTAGTTYYISIRAKNAVGAGTNLDSSELNAKTSTAAPASLVATATTGQIALTWAAAAGATNYNIYRGTATGVYAQIASANVPTSYTDTTVVNGIQYFYVVRGFNGTESANSSEVTGRSIAAFTISSTTAPTTSTIQVTWPATAGASTYDVRYGTATGSYTTTVAGQTSPYTITGLTGGTNYFIVVRAVNAIGSGSTATTAEISQITPLSGPTGLAATSTPTSVALTWNSVVGATNYKIYRGTSTGSYSSLATGNVPNSYTDATAVNGTQYFYVVKAFNGADSADSNEVTAKSIANFSIASTTSPSSTSVQVTWPSPAGGATYDVRYGTATGSYTTTVTGQTSPYTITGLNAGTNYFIVVHANNAIGAGTSVTSSESTQLTALGAPTGLVASTTPGQVGLTWTPTTGASNYNIYRGTTSGVLSLLASANVPASYTDVTAANGTTYYYAVRAFNGSESASSAEVAARPISSFTFTSAITASASTIDLIWTAATGAATYDVRYGTATGTYGSTAASVTSPYTLTGLTAGTTYYISIRAKNAVGAGTNLDSSELNAKTTTAAPASLIATATTGQIALSWAAATGATNYNIYRGTVSGTYAQIASANVLTSYTDMTVVNGTQYYYVVRAFNGTESANSNEVTAKSIAAFTISSTTAPTTSTIQVTWPATAGAATYDVRYGTATGSYTTTVAGVTSPYTITALTGGTNYFIVVRAVNAIGSGSTATTAEVSQITPLSAPTGLVASATPGQAGLNWNAMGGTSSYKVYRGTTSGVLSLLASGVATNAYLDTTAANGTTYFYAVRAFNGSDSADSSEVSVQPISSFSLTAATTASASSINLTWGSATGAATYDVRYGTSTGVYLGTVAGVSSPYVLTGLSSGTTYFISIRAKNAIGLGTNFDSNELNAKTAVGAPTGLAAVSTLGNVALSWNTVSGATNYNVYRGTTSGSYSQIASAVAGLTYNDNPAANGTTYFYMVRTFNGIESEDSTEVSTHPISSFSLTAATSASSSSINVTWGAATGATDYDVLYGTATGSYTTTVLSVTSPYTITGLTANTTYFIIVRARNSVGGGASANTAEVSQITPVAAPTALVATGGNGQVGLTWTATSGASSYKIMRGTVSGTYAQIDSSVSGTTYTDVTAANGTTYYYAVKSFNGADSANSLEVFKRPIATPLIDSVAGNTTTTLLVTWGAATGTETYDVRYGTTSGSYTTTFTGVTSPYSITGLTSGLTYYVQVVGKNAIGGGTTVNSSESSGAPNSAPVLSAIANQTTDMNNVKAVNFTLTDNNDILSCTTSMSGVSSNTPVVPNSNIVFSGALPNCIATITPATGKCGDSAITLTATDGKSPVQQAFLFTINPGSCHPTVTLVTPPSNGTYISGAILNFSFKFSKEVTVTGTPRLPIILTSGTVYANYLSGSGSDTLLFRYTVLPSDGDNNGIAMQPLDLNGGTIVDAFSNNANLTFTSPSFPALSSPVDLRRLESFVGFSGGGAIAIGDGAILRGDIGTYAGAVTGVNTGGAIHIATPTTNNASTDLSLLSSDLNALTVTNSTHAAVFGGAAPEGETIGPGVYSINGGGSVGGVLTLDGEEDPNAFFLIKFNGAMTMGAGDAIHLIRGARSSNVFWLINGALSIGASAIAKGNFVVNPTGDMALGASVLLEGRILTKAGALEFGARAVVSPQKGITIFHTP